MKQKPYYYNLDTEKGGLMVYTDGTYLVADSVDELHAFAGKIGLIREWFQDHPQHPHYNLFGVMYSRAIDTGAIYVWDRDLMPDKSIKSLDAPFEEYGED